MTSWEVVGEKPGKREGRWLRDPLSQQRALLKVPRAFSVRGEPFVSGEVGAEVLAAQVGHLLGVPVPRVEAVWYHRRVCCLAWDFVESRYQLREGVDLLGATSDQRRATFDEIRGALAGHLSEDEATRALTYMACFDILIGNPDRHQGNWGLLMPAVQQEGLEPKMAPFYDNGSAFGSGLDPGRIRQYLGEGLERFDRRFRYEISVTGGKRPRIPEVLEKLAGWGPFLSEFKDRLGRLTDEAIRDLVEGVPPEAVPEPERREFSRRLLMRRRDGMVQEVRRLGL